MHGPRILARSLSKPFRRDRYGNAWSYHSRSDRHSKVACWGALFDLLTQSPLMRAHALEGRIGFGINHTLTDFERNRTKDLDIVVCTPLPGATCDGDTRTFAQLAGEQGVELSHEEGAILGTLPLLSRVAVGSVLMALEAKACMTAHQKALPRLYDELNSSHATVHGASAHAIAVGLVMVNASERFISPDMNKTSVISQPVWNVHKQPRSVEITLDKLRQLPRRTKSDQPGFDALAVTVVDLKNDGTEAHLVGPPVSPDFGDILNYETTIERVANHYATRFSQI